MTGHERDVQRRGYPQKWPVVIRLPTGAAPIVTFASNPVMLRVPARIGGRKWRR